MRPEPECRRPEFTEGCKVKLGDGQEWTFPRPILRVVPTRDESGGFSLRQAPPFGPEYQADLERYLNHDHADDGSFYEGLEIRAGLAVKLLLRNYDLSDAEIQELIYLEPNPSPECIEMWSGIEGAVVGRAPKPSTVG